jgi:hypothetical protein
MAKNFAIQVGIEAIDKVSAPIMKMNAKIKSASQSMTRFRKVGFLPKTHDAMISVSKSMKGLAKATGIPKIIDSMNGIGTAATRAGGAIQSMVMTLSGSGLVVGGVGFGAVQMIKGMTEEGRHLKETSERIGMSSKNLQKYQFAAESAGVSSDALENAFSSLGKSAVQAALGGGEASQVFEALGVKVMDSTGKKIKKVDQLFLELTDSLNSRVKSAPLKREMMGKLLGGAETLPLVNQGRKGIQSSLKTAQKLDFFIDPKQVEQSEKWTKSLATLSFTLKGIRNIIGSELLPVVSETFQQFSESLIANQGELRAFFKDLASSLPAAFQKMKEAAQTLATAFAPLLSVLKFVHESVGLMNVVLGLAAIKIASIVIPAVLSLSGAFASFGAVLLANPIAVILIGLYRLVKVGQFIYEKFEPLKELFSGLFVSPLENLGKIIKLMGVVGKAFASTDWASQGLSDFKKNQTLPLPEVSVKREPLELKSLTNRPSVSGKNDERENSQVTVRFENAPAGMRITSQKGEVNTDIHRGFLLAGAH